MAKQARRRLRDRRAGRGPARRGSWRSPAARASTSCSTAPPGAGTAPVLLGIDALKRREGTLLIQGELAAFPDFPVKKVTEKAITIKSARGHSYRACELAVGQLASGRFPLDLLATHTFGLADVDRAINAIGGAGGDEDVIHVSLLPVGGLSMAYRRPRRRRAPTGRSSTRSPSSASPPCTRRRAARGLLAPYLRPDLPGRAHRRHGGHGQRAARRQLDDPRRRRAVPRRRHPRGRADLPLATTGTSASCSPPRSRRAACAAWSSTRAAATSRELTRMGFPVWSRCVSAAGHREGDARRRQRPARLRRPARSTPGDVIVADDDGVVVVPRAGRCRGARGLPGPRGEGGGGPRAVRRRRAQPRRQRHARAAGRARACGTSD